MSRNGTVYIYYAQLCLDSSMMGKLRTVKFLIFLVNRFWLPQLKREELHFWTPKGIPLQSLAEYKFFYPTLLFCWHIALNRAEESAANSVSDTKMLAIFFFFLAKQSHFQHIFFVLNLFRYWLIRFSFMHKRDFLRIRHSNCFSIVFTKSCFDFDRLAFSPAC